MKISEILYKAADIMQTNGRNDSECWDERDNRKVYDQDGYAYDSYYDGVGSVCLIGAIGAAQELSSTQCYASSPASQELTEFMQNAGYIRDRSVSALYRWNDQQFRDTDEVLTVLRNAAGKAEADGR